MPDIVPNPVPPENNPVQPPVQPVYAGPPAPAAPPPPKRSLPKPLIFGGIGLIVLIVLILVARMVLSRAGVGVTTSEVTWWGLWEDTNIIAPLILEYEAKHPNVKITYIRQSKEDYRERLASAQAKGSGPDIFRFHNSWVPMFKKELDPLPPKVMSATDFAKTYYPIAVSDLSTDAGILGLPLEYDALALFINQDIFSQEGKTPPATWNDLRQTACDLTRISNDNIERAGVALGRTENVDHWPEILALMMLENGVDLKKPTGKLAEDGLKFFSLFSSSQACPKSGGTRVWDQTLPSSTLAFAGGKVAMYFGPSWRAFNIKELNPNLKFKTVPLPQLPKSALNERNVSYASYWSEGVWAKSKNKAAAWDFLAYLSSKESLEKLYANAAKLRGFGEPYPRADMAGLLANDPVVGSIIYAAPDAESWYLQSRTFDGPTGINSQINKYFEDALNAVGGGAAPDKVSETVASGVTQVLSRYGIR